MGRRRPEGGAVRIGAHVSISGRIYDAVPRAESLGCECLQIFYGSPRQWRLVSYPAEDLAEFRRRRAAAALEPLVAHASYLLNLASPDETLYRRSVVSLVHTLQGMDALEGLGVVTHLGSAMGRPWADARARIAWALRAALKQSRRAMILIEGSAGGSLGGTFEQLADLLAASGGGPRLGVCLDTAHLFAAGWDLRTPAGVDAAVRAFDRAVGLRRLQVLHLNDTTAPLGSHLDRHENIGEGAIGRVGFRAVFAHPALRGLCGVIETPGFDHHGPDARNLAILKRLRGPVGREGRRGAVAARGPGGRARTARRAGRAPRPGVSGAARPATGAPARRAGTVGRSGTRRRPGPRR
jgi:deoxyribonuclease-4